jgi:hypothetical protein
LTLSLAHALLGQQPEKMARPALGMLFVFLKVEAI